MALPLAGYLTGSISFSYLAVLWLRGVDIRQVGSRNAGATNVLRVAGRAPAAAVLLLDVAKGAAPAALALELGATPAVVGATAVAAVLGHVFPLYLRFRGGKGVATAVGGLLALAPFEALAAVAVLLVAVAWTRYVSLGSLIGVTLAPILMLVGRVEVWYSGAAAAMALVVVARHAGNIQRLWAGRERRLGEAAEMPR